MAPDLFSLSGRIALVTGGSRGLGRAMARALAKAGAELVICSRTAEELDAAGRELAAETGRHVLAIAADVTQAAGRDAVYEAARERYGRIDILVNNAGIGMRKPVLEMSEDDWRRVLEVDLTAPFLCAQRFVPPMLEHRWGRVINISSALGSIALPDRAAYCAAKGGLLQLTRVMALEWAEQGVTVNAICPGPFKTPYNLALQQNSALYESYLGLIPQHRWAELDEIGGAAVFLASDAAAFVTGTALYVDGGWTAHGGLPQPGARDPA
jgi:NAD(P)-dependent dehydrogenase (short-subunit alcohol dehydrogenase family)